MRIRNELWSKHWFLAYLRKTYVSWGIIGYCIEMIFRYPFICIAYFYKCIFVFTILLYLFFATHSHKLVRKLLFPVCFFQPAFSSTVCHVSFKFWSIIEITYFINSTASFLNFEFPCCSNLPHKLVVPHIFLQCQS